MESPKTPPKPTDCRSLKLVEHLTSAHKFKEQMIEKNFDNQVFQAYFTDELLGMDVDIVVLIYTDPSMLILGPMSDFGSPHPNEKRDEKTRKMERQNHKIKALERFQMLASGVEVDSSMAMTHPNLFVKWIVHNIENGKTIPSIKPSKEFRKKAGTLAQMMVEKEAWKHQLIILENFSCGVDQDSGLIHKPHCSGDCATVSSNFYQEIENKIMTILHKYDSDSDKEIRNQEFLVECVQSPLCSK